MAKIHKWSVMIYGSLQVEFMETKHNGHIHRCGTPIFGKIVVYISKPINNNEKYFGGREIYLDSTCKCSSYIENRTFIIL